MIEWLIVSDRDLGDISSQRVEHGDQEYNALDIARELENTRIVSVLRKFMANPERTRHDLRVKLGLQNGLAAEVYALSVFLCDGLLRFKPALTTNEAAALRFFTIATRLPMELQMILCRVVVGSVKDNILSKNSEVAFKSLARILRLSQ